MKKAVHTDKAPKAIGPYSQAIKTESMVYTSGQVAIDPSTGELIAGGYDSILYGIDRQNLQIRWNFHLASDRYVAPPTLVDGRVLQLFIEGPGYVDISLNFRHRPETEFFPPVGAAELTPVPAAASGGAD